jgi:hypothetical protein
MAERGTLLGGEEPIPRNIEDIDLMKVRITEQLEACGVGFPIRSKRELSDIYPKGTPIMCRYKGKETSIHDIIGELSDSDFPIRTAGDVATLLTNRCEVFPEK